MASSGSIRLESGAKIAPRQSTRALTPVLASGHTADYLTAIAAFATERT
jgi:hypothetical protein